MTESPFALNVEREDGELLVLEGLDLVRGFVAGDPSAKPGGYDSLAGKGDPHRITVDDVRTVNETMRARSRHSDWQQIFDADQSWLSALPADIDIIEADDQAWAAAEGAALVSAAIRSCIRPGIALARATKVLHLKRPRVFPVLDELVLQMMGLSVPDDQDTARRLMKRVAVAQQLTSALRREGRRNIGALQRIQTETAIDGLHLSLVRLLDITLWFSHPAASVPGVRREIAVRGRP